MWLTQSSFSALKNNNNKMKNKEQHILPFLERLLDGAEVEWKKLGEVCDFKNGFAFKSNLFKEKGLPIIRISNITGTSVDVSDVKYFDIQDYHKNGNPLDYSIDKGDVLIAMSGATTAKIGYYDKEEKAYQNQRVGKFIPQKNILNSRFLYHFLQTRTQYIYNLAGGGAQPNLSSNDIKEKIIIPVPSISVQEEIVRILDKFTTLEAELDCRKRQYEYYRNQLLSFKDGSVTWKSLGAVIKPTVNIKWSKAKQVYRYIDLTSVNIETRTIFATEEITSETAPSRAKKIVLANDVIFATTRPTQMRITVVPCEYNNQVASTGYCVLRADDKQVLSKWIYFLLSTNKFRTFLEDNQSGTAYPAISDSKLKEFQIPVPPLSEQQRIVSILDKFDTLTTSISEGLPKEIELRRKQYEYYREQLLSFRH